MQIRSCLSCANTLQMGPSLLEDSLRPSRVLLGLALPPCLLAHPLLCLTPNQIHGPALHFPSPLNSLRLSLDSYCSLRLESHIWPFLLNTATSEKPSWITPSKLDPPSLFALSLCFSVTYLMPIFPQIEHKPKKARTLFVLFTVVSPAPGRGTIHVSMEGRMGSRATWLSSWAKAGVHLSPGHMWPVA